MRRFLGLLFSFGGLALLLAGAAVEFGAGTAAVMLVMLGLLLGLVLRSRGRRRTPETWPDPERADVDHRALRRLIAFELLVLPLACLAFFVYLDSTLAAGLIAGGVAVTMIFSIPVYRLLLSRLREAAQADGAGERL